MILLNMTVHYTASNNTVNLNYVYLNTTLYNKNYMFDASLLTQYQHKEFPLYLLSGLYKTASSFRESI